MVYARFMYGIEYFLIGFWKTYKPLQINLFIQNVTKWMIFFKKSTKWKQMFPFSNHPDIWEQMFLFMKMGKNQPNSHFKHQTSDVLDNRGYFTLWRRSCAARRAWSATSIHNQKKYFQPITTYLATLLHLLFSSIVTLRNTPQ